MNRIEKFNYIYNKEFNPKKNWVSKKQSNNDPITKTFTSDPLVPSFSSIPLKTRKVSQKQSSILQALDVELKLTKITLKIVNVLNTISKTYSLIDKTFIISLLVRNIFTSMNVLSPIISILIDARSLHKIHILHNKIKKIDPRDYTKVCELLNKKQTLRILEVDNKHQYKKIINNIPRNKQIMTNIEKDKIDYLFKNLKGKLKTNQKEHLIGIASSSLSLAFTSLRIASITFPPLFIISTVFSIGIFIGTTLYNRINNYRFESKAGMIERNPKDLLKTHSTLWKINDFMKWNFNNTVRIFVKNS